MIETWRQIDGWTGYEVSDLGRVRSWKWPSRNRQWIEDRSRQPRVLRAELRNGYPSVLLSDARLGLRKLSIHVAVLRAFISPRPEGLQAAHWDGDKTNNDLQNLRWASPRENNFDKIRHGTHLQGERVGTAKLLSSQITEIRLRRVHGEKVKHLAVEYGVCRNTITNLTTGKTYRDG